MGRRTLRPNIWLRQSGAAISEYLPIIGIGLSLMLGAIGNFSSEVRQHGGKMSLELAGIEQVLSGGNGGDAASGNADRPGPPSDGGGGESGSSGSGGGSASEGAGSGSGGGGVAAPGLGSGQGSGGSGGDSGSGDTSGGSGGGGPDGESGSGGSGGQGGTGGGTGETPVEEESPLGDIVEYASNFVKGAWDGAKTQFWDLVQFVKDPIKTATDLKDFVVALFTDTQATVDALVQEIGNEAKALATGDAYAIGKFIGENVSPAALTAVVNRLRKLAGFAENARKLDSGCSSFLEGTLVWTESGLVPIETIEVGDLLHTRSDQDYTDNLNPVAQLFRRQAEGYYEMTAGTETLRVTSEHPVWLQGGGWTEVKDLKPGNAIAAAEGDVLVRKLKYVKGPVSVYNFEVERNHNYFVSSHKLWVHNANDVCDFTPQDAYSHYDNLLKNEQIIDFLQDRGVDDEDTLRRLDGALENSAFAERANQSPELLDAWLNLPGGNIPGVAKGAFNKWFDELSVDELDLLWTLADLQKQMKARARQPGGLHEWCMVCRLPTLKEWGVSMDEIKRFRTKTSELTWVDPTSGKPGQHGGEGSGRFHSELKKIIDSSNSITEFNEGMIGLVAEWSIDQSVIPDLILEN